MSRSKKEEPPVRIINIMADGRIVEDLTGHVIPVTPETLPFYKLVLARGIQKLREEGELPGRAE